MYKPFVYQNTTVSYSDEIEINLPFNKFLSTFWNISGGLCTQVLYSWVRDDLKPNVSLKSSIYMSDMETILSTIL